jgi:LSD1 subclass zinc finger protein
MYERSHGVTPGTVDCGPVAGPDVRTLAKHVARVVSPLGLQSGCEAPLGCDTMLFAPSGARNVRT